MEKDHVAGAVHAKHERKTHTRRSLVNIATFPWIGKHGRHNGGYKEQMTSPLKRD
jgi:hypothetical protein